jgi:hypothetical protein
MPHLRSLLHWATEQHISSLADVTNKDLDRYLEAVRDSESKLSKQAALLNAVRRLWVFRDLLPPEGRLPEAPPWKGKDNRILLGRTRYDLENRTRRIPEPTMSAAGSAARVGRYMGRHRGPTNLGAAPPDPRITPHPVLRDRRLRHPQGLGGHVCERDAIAQEGIASDAIADYLAGRLAGGSNWSPPGTFRIPTFRIHGAG